MKNIKTILFISLSVLFFIISFLIDNNDISNDNIDYNKIQKILLSKEKSAEKIIDYYSNELLTKDFNTVIKQNSKKLDKLYNKDKISIYIFDKQNNLRIWSDNIVSGNKLINDNRTVNYAEITNNHLVEVIRKKIDDKTFIALVHIKVTYPYKNQFINSHFVKDFDINDNYKISLLKSNNDISFHDSKNNFLFSLIKTKPVSSSLSKVLWVSVFLILSFVFYLLFTKLIFVKFLGNKLKILGLLAFIFDLFLFRFLMLKFNFPLTFQNIGFFKPQNYASSFWFPSLGDFFINVVFISIFALFFYKFFNLEVKSKKQKITISTTATLLISFITIFYIYTFSLIDSLIINSNINFEPYKILDLNFYSVIAYVIIAIIFSSFIILLFKIIKELLKFIGSKKILFFTLIISFVVFVLSILFIEINYLIVLNFYILFLLILFYFKIKKDNIFSYKVLIVFVVSIFTSIYVINKITQKEISQRKVLILNLSNQRDLIAELLFENYEKQLVNDKVLISYMQNPFINIDKINKYLQNNYFHGYLNKYDFQTTICGSIDSLILENEKATVNCYDYFNDYIKKYGTKINNTNFYFLENSNGRISYITALKFYTQISEINLYIEIDSKLISEELGYPELLLDSKMQKNELLNNYSFAKYYKNKLITQSGDFKYNLRNNYIKNPTKEFTLFKTGKYLHLAYKVNKNNIIILSAKQADLSDYLISQSYVFSFNFILFLIILLFWNYPFKINIKQLSFSNKIQISILSILLILFIIILWITISYNRSLFDKNQHKIISEKTQSVLIEMEDKFGDYDTLTPDMNDYILYILTKFSNVFYSDINLYNTKGELIETSRPEIIEKGLTSKLINPVAYRELVLNKKMIYVQTEKIGKLKFQSSYVPFKNNRGKILAYLNLPYFTKQNKIKQEISSIIVAIINLYVFILVIATIIIILISNQITRPLRFVRDKLNQIKITGKPELINYKSNDEIGDLVNEYNELATELDQYITKVSKLERETAWRQMAKQIAHEIKNPLTPMKLSIQYLKRSWDNKSENFDKQITNTTKTLIEQIDTLANIASAFSDFASMPPAKNEKININKIIADAVQIFDKTPNCKIEFKNVIKTDIFVYTDRNQLIRVFNNLIKNAIQSIPEGRFGKVSVSISEQNNYCIIEVSDNGGGIPDNVKEKLFEPNFTTKSSGSGLGLAMVKNIIENAEGKIWFETELDKGTSFFVKLPLGNKE